MDGYVRSTPLLGILYAEDFDDPKPQDTVEPVEEALPPPLTQADIDRACVAAVEEARTGWEAIRTGHRSQALAAISGAIEAVRDETGRETAALAEGIASTMLSMLSGALPVLCRDHGPAEARALVQRLIPLLRREPRITIRVHPSLVPVLRDDLAPLEDDIVGTITVAPAALAPGDVRVTWGEGSFVRDTQTILAAMQGALAELGLVDRVETTPERRMALAQ
ncbi:MAG: hypothetical protein NVSMB18_17460 [Acetobacteraceae bacterium]